MRNYKTPRKLSALVIIALLLMRFMLTFLSLIDIPEIKQIAVLRAYQVLTYALTAFLIWLNKDELDNYHFDQLSLIIFLVFRTILYAKGEVWNIVDYLAYGAFWVIAIKLFWVLRKHLTIRKIKTKGLIWIIIGVLSGIGFSLCEAMIMPSKLDKLIGLIGQLTFSRSIVIMMVGFFLSFSNEAIDEEVLFRGFLWGYLKRIGYNEKRILLIQGLLFWVMHIHLLIIGKSGFWLGLPFSLLVGILAWRSRSIAASMATHAATNALAYFTQ